MKPNYQTFKPQGFSSVNTYLFVNDVAEYLSFLERVFDAKELNRTEHEGRIANLILTIGDTAMMLAQPQEAVTDMRTSFYLYVENVDEVYQHALENGCTSVFEPADMPYGDRQGGIEDPIGNYWWVSKRLSETDYSN